MDIASDELAEFRSELRSASPVLLHQFRDVLTACCEPSVVYALIYNAVTEIDAALVKSREEFH